MAAVFRFGNVEVDAAQRRVRVNGQPVSLGARAFDVLLALIERRDRVVSKDELLDVAWPGLVVEQGNVQVQVSALRAAIGRDAIATVQGFGYRFTLAADDGPADAPSAEPSADPLVGPATDTDRPTIAVLALGHAPGDGDGQALAQSLATEVVIELARNADLGVASALASFSADLAAASAAQLRQRLHSRYLVHGSVHRDAGVPWLDLALIDTADERLIWSLREPLNLPREALVRRIAGAVHARAWDAEVAHAIASPLNESDARALTMRSLASYREFHVDAAARARALLEQALQVARAMRRRWPGWPCSMPMTPPFACSAAARASWCKARARKPCSRSFTTRCIRWLGGRSGLPRAAAGP